MRELDLGYARSAKFEQTLEFFFTSATEHRVYTVINESILMTNDPDNWSYKARSEADSQTGLPLMEGIKTIKTISKTSINSS